MGLLSKGNKNEMIMDEYNDIPDYIGYCPDCPVCGETMGYSYSKSEFKCFSCGTTIDEYDLQTDEEDEDDIPWGCRTCGGPYPLCTTSCKMFDE